MLENKIVETVYGKVHYSRIVASWTNCSGDGCFEAWLESLAKQGIANLTENNMRELTEMYTCGKMELELNVKQFKKNCRLCDGTKCFNDND